jgi:hypothetical protein
MVERLFNPVIGWSDSWIDSLIVLDSLLIEWLDSWKLDVWIVRWLNACIVGTWSFG